MPTKTIDLKNYREIEYNGVSLFFDKKYIFHKHFKHKLKTKRFPYHKNLVVFLKNNKDVKIFFTLDENIKPFKKFENGFLINIDSYLEFCKSIASNTKGRARAFLGQHISISNISATKEEKDDYIKTNITEENILETVKSFGGKFQQKLLTALKKSTSKKDETDDEITKDQFLSVFEKFLSDEDVQVAFFKQTPRLQIETLEKLLIFLENNLDKGEAFIQNWIDENEGKYRKQRCLIFGIEYVDPKREGELNRKRFDILADQNRENHVLIELKPPNSEIFKIEDLKTKNSGKSTEYSLSTHMSRAIPQVLGYKEWYEQAKPEELEKLGIRTKKNISKCIIVISKNQDNEVWKGNLKRLRENLPKIEIVTYTDLIDKLKNTIKNLKEI